MATSVTTLTKSESSTLSVRWIISARDDLIWFIGSVLSSYALLLLYIKGVLPLLVMVPAWAILIDAPHVFGTFSRTYFDRAERVNRKRLLWGSLAFFVIGPLMILLRLGLIFFFLAALWAYYHLVKQHYGFMVLYKKKNHDLAPVDNAVDRLFLLFAFNYPFVAFIARDPEAMARVPATLQAGVNGLATVLLIGTLVLGLAWVGRQLQRFISRQSLDVPKYLLLGAAIPMHWIVLLTPMPHKPIAIVAILTIYHNLQYHRLIWFHNKKYSAPDSIGVVTDSESVVGSEACERIRQKDLEAKAALQKKYGAAAFISRRLPIYIAFGILFGILYQGPRQYLGYLGLRSNANTLEQSLPAQLAIAFLWGYAFIHYYLDSKIWRVRRDPSVGQALKMS